MGWGRQGLVGVVLALVAAVAAAAPYAVVDAVQAPAWLERNAGRKPLLPGMALENRDRVVTGAGARAVIQLADGSAVKLGENVEIGLNAFGRRDDGVFTAGLDVVKGAFRLTTDLFRRYLVKRAINVRIGTVTAGIRGTDIWGRSDGERDFVCLLEGHITASHPQGSTVDLTEPLQFYGADRGQAPGAVALAEREQVAKWSLDTELRDGAGVQRAGGRWSLRLGDFPAQAEALALYDRLAAAGYGARIVPLRQADGQHRYAVRLALIPSQDEARRLADRLAREQGVEGIAVERR